MRPSWWLLLLVSAVTGGVGVWAGRRAVPVSTTVTTSPAERAPRECQPVPAQIVAPDPATYVDDMRKVLREEVARELDTRAKAQDGGPATDNVGATPEQLAVFTNAFDLVRSARVARHWREEDRDRLRVLIHQLTPEDRTEIMRTVAPALNSGEMK